MNTFIKIQKDFRPNENFWELNPHLIYVKPFSKKYNADPHPDKIQSSKDMWCIVWMIEPDEDENKYYRLSESERLDVCLEFNPAFDVNNEITEDCMKSYPDLCLTVEAQSYKIAKDFLVKRNEFLKTADYNFDTMNSLENAVAKTPKILEDFAKVEREYLQSKNKDSRVRGGRQPTAREKGLIIAPKEDEE
jgi:hypothetical protein